MFILMLMLINKRCTSIEHYVSHHGGIVTAIKQIFKNTIVVFAVIRVIEYISTIFEPNSEYVLIFFVIACLFQKIDKTSIARATKTTKQEKKILFLKTRNKTKNNKIANKRLICVVCILCSIFDRKKIVKILKIFIHHSIV